MVVRWTFDDVWRKATPPYRYTWAINPNAGGSPTIEKQLTILSNTGPNRGAILQEGQNSVAAITFSGSILTQAHYETLEIWFAKRILIDLTDDLGRVFRGVFSSWQPQRVRRASNPWFHTYTCEFKVFAYRSASGKEVYGRFRAPLSTLPNLVVNGDFADPVYSGPAGSVTDSGIPPGWQQGNDTYPLDTVLHGTPYNPPDGGQAVYLTHGSGDPAPGSNAFLEQVVDLLRPNGQLIKGTYIHVVAMAHLHAEGAAPIPAFGGRGLMLSVTEYQAGAPHGAPGNIAQANTPITLSNQWHQLSTRIYVPASAVRPVVQVRLYTPTRGDAMSVASTAWTNVVLREG